MNEPDYIFAKGDLTRVFEAQLQHLREAVSKLALGQVEESVAKQTEAALLARYRIEPLEMFWDREEHIKEEVLVERPSDYGGTYRRQEVILRVRVPYAGERDLFSICPSGFTLNAPRAIVEDGYLEFVYQAGSNDLHSIRRSYDEDVGLTKQNVAEIKKLVDPHNERLPSQIQQAIETRRRRLLADDQSLAALGFKVRRRGDPPAMVSFPVKRKQVIPPMPVSGANPIVRPDPVLEMAAYDDILGNLAGMSVAIERSPTTFANIEEEPLRDWFLVALNGNFRGDATGETFNREGKCDISIRVNGGVIFIAECKFWGGEKILLGTITQLLGYLTWRDSKAAVLLFSRNADLTAVLRQIPEVIKKHENFVRQIGYPSETGFRFLLRNKTDPVREHLVTLLAFNVPRAS